MGGEGEGDRTHFVFRTLWERSETGVIILSWQIVKGTQSGIIGSKLRLPRGPESVAHLWNSMAHILVCVTRSAKWQARICIIYCFFFVFLLLTWCLNRWCVSVAVLSVPSMFVLSPHWACDVKCILCAYPLLFMLNKFLMPPTAPDKTSKTCYCYYLLPVQKEKRVHVFCHSIKDSLTYIHECSLNHFNMRFTKEEPSSNPLCRHNLLHVSGLCMGAQYRKRVCVRVHFAWEKKKEKDERAFKMRAAWKPLHQV